MLQVDLHGPAGRLEGLLEGPAEARFAAVVCHPHPRFGGTLHNHATYRLAKAVRAAGGVSLRFNYRGVGRSGGSYDAGRGEALDTRAALTWLRAERPGIPLVAAGFSFGAWMAAHAGGAEPEVRGLLLAGLALRSADLDLVRDSADVRGIAKPVAVIQASRDEFGTPEEVELALAGSAGPRRLVAIPGATHLFGEALQALQREAEAALAWLLGEAR
ncbi:alpha/beta hydrolase [Anaeromyxobacter oryzae]|uniref:Alpha/beta hydrolase n=1 Tax=Anaeromyxobacter oryzae TaxID=2918170 RepID=A0ABM7WTG7_9BACT|nr:alpha/beta family hydrolase [Anaeromyxobacter oryzae]BDG02785.1 alpha/beta hydrolase [Anaeromyxobacter oryzae]